MARQVGRLGSANVTGTANTAVYTVPAGHEAAVNTNITNTGTIDATVRLYFATSSSAPAAAHEVEHDIIIRPGTTFLRTGDVLAAGEIVVVQKPSAGGSIVVDVRGVQNVAG